MLKLLAEYFCLTSHDIARLVRDREPNENDKRTLRHTLQLLHRAGLVNRLPYYDLLSDRSGKTYVYGLSGKTINHLDEWDIWDPDFAKIFDEHSERTLDHELEISYFHIALKDFCKKRGLELFWQQSDLKKAAIAPDAYFAISNQGKWLHYFLEMERAKIGNIKNGESSIMRKLHKYFDYYDTDACEKEWESFRRFRIIIVQRNDIKRQNLLKQFDGKYKNRMFWLTTEPAYKENIGAEIFNTPKDYPQRSYSFTSS